MPADSDQPISLPHTWRPLGVRVAVVILLVALVAVSALTWIGFDAEIRARFTFLQKATLIGFGLATAVFCHALARSRVVAQADRLIVVNGYRRREYAWAQVIAARLPAGAPWARLDLSDGTTVVAMGIQGSDGDRARAAVRELRSVIEHQTPG